MDETDFLMAELLGPRHDATDLIFSNRDDEGNPTAYWTVRLKHTEHGKWRFSVRNWKGDLHTSDPIYEAEKDARAAGHQWLIDYINQLP